MITSVTAAKGSKVADTTEKTGISPPGPLGLIRSYLQGRRFRSALRSFQQEPLLEKAQNILRASNGTLAFSPSSITVNKEAMLDAGKSWSLLAQANSILLVLSHDRGFELEHRSGTLQHMKDTHDWLGGAGVRERKIGRSNLTILRARSLSALLEAGLTIEAVRSQVTELVNHVENSGKIIMRGYKSSAPR